jgi:hypothetical protein
MMLLQADAIQVGQWAVSLTTLGLVLRLTFSAGQLVEKVEANEKRIEHLEKVACPHQECPFKVRSLIDLDREGAKG